MSFSKIYLNNFRSFNSSSFDLGKKNLIIGGQYGISKYLAENEITNLPVNYIIFRSSTIYKEEEVVEVVEVVEVEV